MQDLLRMTNPPDLRELLLAYLLDEMADDERERVDQQMLLDDDFSAGLKEAEFDLLDAYEAGQLTVEQRDRVYVALVAPREQRIGASIRDAEMAYAQRIAAPVVEMPRRSSWRWVAAVAAAMIFAAGLTISLRDRSPKAPEAAITASAVRPADQAAASASATPPIRTSPSEARPITPANPVVRQSLGVLTLVLPETTRGSSGLLAKLQPTTEFLRVEWPGASGMPSKEARSLRLTIADEERVVATAPLDRLQSNGGAKHVTAIFLVSVKGLAPGSYLFRVTGPEAGSAAPQVYAENSITVER
jgi:hypothetical protein